MFPWMHDDLGDLRRRGLYRQRRKLLSGQGAHVRVAGVRLINFASNDYLDFASDPRLAQAAQRAARRFGCGAGASPLVSGLTPPLQKLERDLAAWEGSEAALVFSSGYVANLTLLSTLVGQGDVIFSDAWNHASLIDGCRLSRADVSVYRHSDVAHLIELLSQTKSARRRLIVSDSVFSMDGDFAPLAELLDVAERFDAMLLLDEAHATGVLGKCGRGLSECISNATSPRLIKMGTLSKALGSQGGFVVGAATFIDWLVNRARPYIFSTALAPPSAAAARRAVRLVQEKPHRGMKLLAKAEGCRTELRELGLDVGPSQCQIVPVIVGDPTKAVLLSRKLQERGLLVPAIRPPSVAEGTSRLRISLTAGHTNADIEQLVAALRDLRQI